MTDTKVYLSWSLKSSVERFNKAIQNSEDPLEIIEYNTVCVILTIAFAESYINEIINSANDWNKIKFNSEFISNLNKIEKSLSIIDKYDIIAIELEMSKFNRNIEPYTSLNNLTKLRNEIIHYKGLYTQTNKGVSKSTTSLMQKFKIFSNNNSNWVNDLFKCKQLSQLCLSTLIGIDDTFTILAKNILKKS